MFSQGFFSSLFTQFVFLAGVTVSVLTLIFFLFFCQKHGVCFLNLLIYLSHCPLNFESMSAWFSIFSVLKYFLYLSLTVNCLAIHGCLIPFNFIGHFPSFFKTLITDQCTNYIFTTSFLFSFAQFF